MRKDGMEFDSVDEAELFETLGRLRAARYQLSIARDRGSRYASGDTGRPPSLWFPVLLLAVGALSLVYCAGSFLDMYLYSRPIRFVDLFLIVSFLAIGGGIAQYSRYLRYRALSAKLKAELSVSKALEPMLDGAEKSLVIAVSSGGLEYQL